MTTNSKEMDIQTLINNAKSHKEINDKIIECVTGVDENGQSVHSDYARRMMVMFATVRVQSGNMAPEEGLTLVNARYEEDLSTDLAVLTNRVLADIRLKVALSEKGAYDAETLNNEIACYVTDVHGVTEALTDGVFDHNSMTRGEMVELAAKRVKEGTMSIETANVIAESAVLCPAGHGHIRDSYRSVIEKGQELQVAIAHAGKTNEFAENMSGQTHSVKTSLKPGL